MNDGLHLDVGDGHAIRVLPFGNPAGVPVVCLHGGPGSGCSPEMQSLFDAARHRVVFIDQRGAGQSLPARSRHANTTAHLIADMERVRAHLGIDRWLVVGGSWGVTLALAYAQTHPSRVTGLALRATFLGTRAELDWAFRAALAAFQPALHDALFALVAPADRHDPLRAVWRLILHPDPAVHAPAVRAFYRAERALSQLGTPAPLPDEAPLPATPFMEAHYFLNDCFLPPDSLLAGADRLAGVPGIMVQARLDLLCPPRMSHRLAPIGRNRRSGSSRRRAMP
ncbi:alpha/beta fold hydrolase [Paracoccaceae bacterium Fryx2]|nr:alpha/beta fold hydrolase [Paracoccaceae bacterium Fryx2]